MSRVAVVLFNLGGPDRPQDVRPFLRNLFRDPAIIAAPGPIRMLLSEVISRSRETLARANYAVLGGGSPLRGETEAQASALEAELARRMPGDEVRCFVAMRYWAPTIQAAAAAVAGFAPDDVVLLPLYPQFSTTTTGSSLKAWSEAWQGKAVRTVCCYFDDEALADAHAAAIERTWTAAGRPEGLRLLFSAHGLPERTLAGGDPYQWQVEETAAKVAARLGDGWDWQVCYQSRVGPLRWIGPSTVEAIEAAANAGLGVIVDPIAFVSEHVETLVELDRDYAEAARRAGAPAYLRVPTLSCEPRFIEGLAKLAEAALAWPGVRPGAGACPARFGRCALRRSQTGAGL
ncbi:MAG: ferrochelatase [Caulobacteraceae bacterium]|nr:ferrochelatase [Caulobacteraceae bacterium]